jgi:hypothetical protein
VVAAALYLPPGLLLVGAVATWGLGYAGLAGRWPAILSSWLALATLLGTWILGGAQPAEGAPPLPAGPIPLVLRLDAISVAFGLAVLVPVSLLLTFQARSWHAAGSASLAIAFAVTAVEAGSLLLTALALGACAALVGVVLRSEDDATARSPWVAVLSAAVVLGWAGAALQAFSGGTSLFSAVPVDALKVPVFLLIVLAAMLCAGLVPWRMWVSSVWRRERIEGAGLAVCLLVPLGLLLITRLYTLGGGAWPAQWLHWAMAALGGLVAVAAAVRAQAVRDRRSQLGEAVPLAAGLATLALSLGTPLGIVAGVTGALAVGMSAALGMLLPRGGRVALLGVPLAVGAPPGLVFGAHLLTVQATLEAGGQSGLWAIVVVVSWFLGYVAAVRAAGLPAGAGAGSRRGTYAASALMVIGGAGLGAVSQLIALPAATELVRPQTLPITGGIGAVLTASGGFGALYLAIPLLVVFTVLAFLTRPLPESTPTGRPAVVVPVPARMRSALPSVPRLAPLPEMIRDAIRVEALERAMALGHPWFWGAVVLVLVIAVTR